MKKFSEIFLLLLIFVLLGSTSTMATETTYTVKSGDSLWKIASEHGMSVSKLMELNHLQSDKLNIGDKLILQASVGPTQSTTVNQSNSSFYIVQSGDCLSLIAQRHGMSVETLKQLNNLSSDLLQVGQKLQVKTIVSTAPAAPVATGTAAESCYIVQSGDCLGGIAQKYSMSASQLMSINGLSSDTIYPGQKLALAANTTAANTTVEVSRSGSTADGQRILDIAKQYLGVPYAYGGTSPAGFDCSGFVQYVFKQCGYQLSRTAAAQYQQGTAVSKADLMVGDIVCFACNGGGIDHSGIYAGDNRFIHSSSPRSGGVIYTSLSESYYSSSYVGARRIVR